MVVAKIRRYMISTTTLFCRKHNLHSKTPKTETGETLNGKTETEHTLNNIHIYTKFHPHEETLSPRMVVYRGGWQKATTEESPL